MAGSENLGHRSPIPSHGVDNSAEGKLVGNPCGCCQNVLLALSNRLLEMCEGNRYELTAAICMSRRYTQPSDANSVTAPHPSATPRSIPASTSLRKCIPSTMREMAMLIAKKNSGPSRDG